MVLRIVDIETTGTDPEADAIIEIASVDLVRGVDGTMGLAREQQHICNPGREIPPESSAVHHIVAKDVAQAPPLSHVIDHYKGADVYIAHNAAFERGFIEKHLGGSWLCTYRCALRVWPDAPAHNNQTLRYMLGYVEPFGRPRQTIAPHRALSDCIVTACVLLELIQRAAWSDLMRWSQEPPLISVCRFGAKHRGKRFDQIAAEDPSYLTWIAEKSDLDEATKFSARHWLENPRRAA